MIQKLQSLKNIRGKIVLLRADLNVPIQKGVVKDAFRIETTLPTISYLQKQGARILMVSHLGGGGSLRPVYAYLKKRLAYVSFASTTDEAYELLTLAKPKDIVLLENVRLFAGEEKNDAGFGAELSALADVYVNDAFSVSHRKHASIMRPPEYLPSYMGLQMDKEIAHLSGVLQTPKRPFVFILGGAKFDTKLPLIKKFAKDADTIFIGGALLNNFYKASGYEVGVSLVDDDAPDVKSLLKNKKFFIPKHVVVSGKNGVRDIEATMLTKDEKNVDIGNESVLEFIKIIKHAKTVLWNGPLGLYEDGYDKATKKILKVLVSNGKKTKVIIGGGDTALLVHKMKLDDKIGFVSTGGGATLEFLAKGNLVGIKALEVKQ